MKCEMCLYLKIDDEYYPFCSPCLCAWCEAENKEKSTSFISSTEPLMTLSGSLKVIA